MIFAEPVNNNVGEVAMFIKNHYKISERKDFKIAYSIEDLWVEIATITNFIILHSKNKK